MNMTGVNDSDSEEVLWRHFEILCKSLAAAGKSQSRFVTTLLAFLALLWGWHFMRPTGLSVQFLGITLSPSGLWTISPAILTVLVLALIGSMNIMGPIWKRLRICTEKLNQIFFWTDLDPHKTLIDFLTFLTVWPEGPVEPVRAPPEEILHRFAVFSYPTILLFATITTAMADYPNAPWPFRVYVYSGVVAQLLFSFRMEYEKNKPKFNVSVIG
ncbi:MAG: hypothetical protein HY046_00085 [Acidobacteria bacterium]|nr:hypothetical protein [Acidobacteriota bacterium]